MPFGEMKIAGRRNNFKRYALGLRIKSFQSFQSFRTTRFRICIHLKHFQLSTIKQLTNCKIKEARCKQKFQLHIYNLMKCHQESGNATKTWAGQSSLNPILSKNLCDASLSTTMWTNGTKPDCATRLVRYSVTSAAYPRRRCSSNVWSRLIPLGV